MPRNIFPGGIDIESAANLKRTVHPLTFHLHNPVIRPGHEGKWAARIPQASHRCSIRSNTRSSTSTPRVHQSQCRKETDASDC
ncbi:MAG: hypothetical protein CMJ21_04475 [Phycisphaerae bacterium]|nr:hypothetical protein [Phycisphaerae bacterium]